MVRFTIVLESADDDFTYGAETEIAAILARIENHISRNARKGICRDSNGNTVGRWELTKEG